jgi:competence protein ComEC
MLTNLISYFIVWNIGQGQFTTAIDSQSCQHFDVGGEINVMSHVKQLCFYKMNFIYLSHWDLDHIGFVSEFQKKQFRHCVIPPKAKPTKKFAKKILQKIPICKANETTPRTLPNLIYSGSTSHKASTNDQSMVYQLQNILIPGDSTSAQEKFWSSKASKVDYLVLGHHGSKTSTSIQLLKQIPKTLGAICSARKKKYNHPHFQVVQSLKQSKIPLLRTEDWGHLVIDRVGGTR